MQEAGGLLWLRFANSVLALDADNGQIVQRLDQVVAAAFWEDRSLVALTWEEPGIWVLWQVDLTTAEPKLLDEIEALAGSRPLLGVGARVAVLETSDLRAYALEP
jgi:hypothetical protein